LNLFTALLLQGINDIIENKAGVREGELAATTPVISGKQGSTRCR